MISLRSRLFHGTAVAALALLPNTANAAGNLPGTGNVASGNITAILGGTVGNIGGAAGSTIVVDQAAPILGLAVAGNKAIVNWDSFDVAAGRTVNFSNLVPLAAYSVLNRVTNPVSPSVIAGSITGIGGGGTIFVINEAGISFANSASVTNLSGFVASSLDIADADFEAFTANGTGAIRFTTSTALGTGTGTGAGALSIAAGATIAPDSVLLLVAPKFDIQGGALSATSGDAAFVLAKDATVSLNPTSIISVKIDAGTDITGSLLAGTVGGKRVLVAAASASDLVGSLLGVTADLTATTATATDKGIVIAVGRDTPIDGSANAITFSAPDPAATPLPILGGQFVAGVDVSGTLSSSTSVDVGASGALNVGNIKAFGGDATLLGAAIGQASGANTIAASGNVVFGTPGAVTVGAIRAGGTATVRGLTVGSNAASLTGDSVRAGGAVTVNTSGLITLTGLTSTAISAQSTGAGLDPTLASFTGAAVAAADVTLASTGGAVTVNDVSSTANIVGSGTTFTLGTASATHSLTAAAGTGAVTLTASDTGAAAITVLGNYAISGGGAIALQHADASGANVTHDDTLSVSGQNVTVGDIALVTAAPTLVGSGNVTLAANGAAATDGVKAGVVTARNAVTVSSTNGAVTLGGATSGVEGAAPHDVTVTAAGLATVSGAVTSAGNYTVKGGGVSLGGAQAAAGSVLIKSSTGDISTTGSLTADSGGAGGQALVLDSFGSISGGGSLASGTARQSDILIAVGGDIALGTVDARSLASAASVPSPGGASAYTATTANTLATGGAIGFGAVTTTNANTIQSTSTTAAHRDVTITSDTSTTGGVTLAAAGGTLTTGDVKAFGGDAKLTGATSIAKTAGVHAIAASGNVALKSDGAISVDAVRAGGTIVASGASGTNAGSLTGDSLRAGGAVTVNTTGLISLAGANATSAQSTGAGLDATLATFTGGAVAAADVTLASTGGAVTVNDVTSTANIVGSGTTFTLGTASGTHALTAAAGAGAVTLTASDTGAAAITVLGNYAISGGGAIALQRSAGVGANVTHDDTLGVTGKNIVVGDIALAATPPALVGTGNVTLTANGAAATDAVTAGVVTARNAVAASSTSGDVTLGGATSGTEGAAPHGVTITAAAGNANVIGAVSSAGDYTVKALGDATLANNGAMQSAVGDVLIQASGINASGTLVADSTGLGNKRLVLDAGSGGLFNSAAGPVSLIAGNGVLPATAANRSDILLSFGAGHGLSLGTVDADALSSATHGAAPTTVADYSPVLQGGIPALVISGALSATGPIRTVQSLVIGSTGTAVGARNVSLGGVTSATGSVEAFSTTGDLTLTGPVSARTAANLHADTGTLTVGDVSAFGGTATLLGGTAIAKASGSHAIAALNDVLLESPGAITVDAVRSGGTVTVRGLNVGDSALSLTGNSLAANGGFAITTTDAINFGSGFTLATPRKAIDADLAGFNGGAVGNANISLTSTGDAVTVGSIQATGNILIDAATTATVSGNAEAGFSGGAGEYIVKGATVALGGAGTTQKATGNVWILARGAGGIGAAGTLIADDNGAGASRLVLDSAGPITGGANLTGGAGAGPTIGNRSDILIALANPTQPVTLGNIDARSLSRATSGAASVAAYVPIVANQFETAGAVSLGTVSTVLSNVIGSTGTALGARNVAVGGDTSITGSVEIRSAAGSVTASGPVVTATGVNLHADFTPASADPAQGLLTVADVIARGGDATLTGGTAIATGSTANTIAATLNVVLASPGSIAIGSVKAGGTITARGLTTGSSAGSLSGVGLQANGAITAKTTGAIVLTGTGAAATATERKAFAIATGFTGANAADADLTLTSTGGPVTIADAATTGNLTLAAAGLATATGTITVGDATTGAGSGIYSVSGNAITLGGTGVIQSATGSILLATNGAVAVDTLRSAGAITIRGATVGSSAASLSGIALQSNVAIAVTTAGPINLTGIGATAIATERARFDPTLRTFTGAATAPDADISLTSTGAGVSIADASSTGSITLTANGLATATGTVTAGDALTGAGSGNYTVTGGTIALGGGINGQAALGNILLQSPGSITLTALRSGGTITARGLTTGSNAGLLTGDSLQSNGAITVATNGIITLAGVNAPSIATQRKKIDTSLGGFNGAATAPDANIALTTTAGTISVNGGASTGNTTLTAGTAGATGGVTATGTLIAGDATTGAGVGDIIVDGRDAASLANGTATHSIGVTSHANNAVITTALAGTAPLGGSITAQSLATGGHATITSGTTTLGDVKALATALAGIAQIAFGQATQGNVTADGDGGASITAGTTLGAVSTGDVTATSASGNATIGTANARGSVTATAALLADISSGTAVNGSVVASGGVALIGLGQAAINVRALATGGTAVVSSGTATTGNVDALASSNATITSGTATLGNVRATSTGGGLATITTGSAGRSVVATGGSVTLGTAIAGDDIIASASVGPVTATTLTITGLGPDVAATDASGALLTGALTGLGGSNAIIRASTSATISGVVSIAQANAAKTANYDVKAASVVLGTAATPLTQGAAGRVDIVSTAGGVTFAGTGGALQSNVGGNRTDNALADITTAGGGLTITSATGVSGATTNLIANAKTLGGGFDTQARQPGVVVAAAAGGGGLVTLASISGGAVSVSAPVTISIPTITATGAVSLTGVATSGNDTATVSPTTITIDGLNSGYGRADVTVAGGAGAEVASIGVVNGGQVGALQILADTGAATLRAAPSDPTKIASILVESQTGAASILSPATVAAQTIVLRGRQAGSSVLATGPLLATGSVLASGPIVTLGTVTVAGTAADGPGDILIAATTSASLAAGATETAVARRSINVSGGTALLGDGTATGGTLAITGSTVTVTRRAIAGDDVVLTSLGALTATNAVITTTGAADLQAGDDSAPLNITTAGTAAGIGYGTGHTVITNVLTPAIDTATGGNLTRLAGANIVATAGGNIDFSAATVTAAPLALQRDVHIETGGTLALANTTAARQLIVASTGNLVATGTLTAGDDLVAVSGAAIDVRAATLQTVGSVANAVDARRADGSLLTSAAAGGALTNLAGSNIALGAAGAIQLGAIVTTGAPPSSLRAFSNADISTTQAIATTGSIALVGATVASPFALTAGDDIVAIGRGGAATLDGVLTTSGVNASNAPLADLAGNGIVLPGEAALGRVDGSSILVASTGLATVSTTVSSSGRYSIYGRGGITLGTDAPVAPGTAQSAARDVLLEASIGAAPAPASISLANNMVLTANSDGVETTSGGGFIADPLVVRLGNGSLNAGTATLRVLRTAAATLGDQGTVQVQPVIADGVKSITIANLDSATADLRALNDVTVTNATVDGGLTLASKAGAVSLATLTVGTGTPLMTPAQVAAIDLKLSAATGATLGNVVAGANQLRDITVATASGTASITGAAGARDDIVVASTTGAASAASLSFVGTASDSEAGVATVAATDANGVALADPYGLTGPTITGLVGRNIVISGATGATLGTVTTAASDSLGDVRVLTAAGPATLTTVSTGGAGLPGRVIVATRNGMATGTTLNASGDIIVDAGAGDVSLSSGTAGRDAILVGRSVGVGFLNAGDDIVVVAQNGSVNATSLVATGANSGDSIATVARADGSSIIDPVVGGPVGGLLGGNIIVLARQDAFVGVAVAAAPSASSFPGLVRIAALGSVQAGSTTITAGDILLTGATVESNSLSAGRDITVSATGLATIPIASAGRDFNLTAGSAVLGSGFVGDFIAAQRNFVATTSGALTLGTIRAGQDLTATGGSVTGAMLGAGDAVTVRATAGDATIVRADSTGFPLLHTTDFATTGTAAGTTRDISVTASGAATLTTGTAVHSITVAGTTATATAATANTGGTDGDLSVTGTTGGATLGTGSARDIRVAATGGGAVTATTATASRDLYLDASGGTATLVTGTAGRDGVIVGPVVAIGSLTAGDDIVAVASAGTLTATTLASTGANSGDAIATITRASGLPVIDPVTGGSVGGMTGGNVVALASGNIAVATATATAPAGATVPGLVRLASLNGTTTVTTATASAGDVVLAGVGVSGGTVTAGRDATATSTGGDISIGSVSTGRDLLATSANDIVIAGLSNAGGNATLTAARDINLGATVTGDALDTVGNATLTSGRDIVVLQRTSIGAALAATAGGAATLAGTASGTTTTIATQGDLTLTADAVATGALTLTSAAGAITAPNIGGNGITLTAANAATVTGAATSTGALTATAGSLSFGTIAAAADATLHATGAIGVTGATVIGGALTATSDAGAITTGAVSTGGPAIVTAANPTTGAIVLASLTTTGTATLTAGQSATVTGAATTSGALTATATNGSLSFGSIAAGGAATLRARTALTVTGLARSGGALDALSSAGALSFGSTQAATTVALLGATGVKVTSGTIAGGTATIVADSGPIATGDINAGGDTVVTATNGSATLASVSKTGRLTVTAATDATIAGAIATTGDTVVTATNGSATLGGAVRTANYTVRAINGTIALGTGVVQASSGTVTLGSQRLTIGAGSAVVAPTRIQLDVTGNAAGVSLGDGAGAAAGTTKYTLSKADLRKFQSPVLEIAAVGRSVDIGEVDLDGVAAVAGGFAGVTNAFGIRTTGDIRIADRLTFTSPATTTTPRLLTLGGAAGGADLDKTTTTANAIKVLAVSGLDNSVTGTGGQINAAGSTVQLRATYIALGETPSPAAGRPFIDTLLPASGAPLTTSETRTQFVNNSSSTLYLATPPYAKQTPTPQALVKAGTLVLAPGQWALIQNTGPTTTPGGGVEVGTLKFNKVAGAAAADPVVGLFGSIAGKTGVASAISVNANNLDGISPNNIRVNGCVALSTAGCIQSAVSIPLINLADPGRTLLISSAPDLALSVELITGATNEALWREDEDDCTGAEKDRCAEQPGQKSPQRESRP